MKYYWVKGRGFVPEDEFERPVPKGPYVRGDVQPYRSMQTGEMIEGRAQHRQHLREHGLIEVGNEPVENLMKPREIPDVPGRPEAIKQALEQAEK